MTDFIFVEIRLSVHWIYPNWM